jgi:PE family
LTGIGSAIKAANAAAAGSTTQVLAAAGDEVSATICGNGGTGGGGIGGGAFGLGGNGSSGQPV